MDRPREYQFFSDCIIIKKVSLINFKNSMKHTFKNPFFYLNTLLFAFLALIILNANAERLHFPAVVQRALAAVAAIAGQGTQGKLAAFAAVNQIGDSIIEDNGTNVGVGGAPEANRKLYVHGNTHLGGTVNIDGTVALDGASNLYVGHINAGTGGLGLFAPGSRIDLSAPIVSVNGTFYTNGVGPFTPGGAIGIAAPGARIDLSAPIVSVNGTLSKSAGSFLIDHPLDPLNKYLQHSFVESPEMRNVYYGQATTYDGDVTITLPDWWMALNGSDKREFNYQFTPIGKWCELFVKDEIATNQFTVASTNADCRFSWTVSGVRHDAYAEKHRIEVEGEKGIGNIYKKGTYFHPEDFSR